MPTATSGPHACCAEFSTDQCPVCGRAAPRFYRAEERAFAPGIVKDWPRVWRMPRKVPHGRLVAVSLHEVIEELRAHGYAITEPAKTGSGG